MKESRKWSEARFWMIRKGDDDDRPGDQGPGDDDDLPGNPGGGPRDP